MLKIIAALLIMTAAGNIFAQTEKSNSESAKIFVNSLGKKDFAAAYALFSDDVKAQVPTEALPQIWAQINVAYGEFRSLKELKKTANAEKLIAVVEFANATQRFQFTFDKQGKILGFVGAPPEESANETVKYETPVYADLGSFTESEVTVGAGGEWALPATLTMPKGKSNVAAVVLVHGSGPNDRDETLGGTKVFKDLAWGLASKGIAVLRYEKRTRQHGAQMGGVKKITVNEETVEDAVLAARLLMQTPNINPKKVFVLGHSLGGYLLPRIGEKDRAIAGFISFAGATLPLEDIMPKQYAYIFALDGAISPAEQEKIDAVKKISAKIKALTAADRDSAGMYFGAPASYYLDLKNYNPPQAAQQFKQPILILQGESDYQVTMTDFANWKNALGKSRNAAFISYPKLTHTFTESPGEKSAPQDYEKPNHVNARVVSDIADWILKL